MPADTLDSSRLRPAFRAEVKRTTRTTAIAAGVIAIVAFPIWAGFDRLVDPAHSAEFTAIRLLLEIPLVALWLSLFTGWGRRHPELVMLLFTGMIQLAIAFMTSRAEGAYAPYALGMSLAIYASSFLLIWPWRYTAALIGLTWVALGVAIATAPHVPDASAIATIGFYLGTASLVAFVGQLHRRDDGLAASSAAGWGWSWSRSAAGICSTQLERLSREDSLTGLANRRSWDETLAREFERARRKDSSWPCCCATSTGSRTSTTASGTPSATAS